MGESQMERKLKIRFLIVIFLTVLSLTFPKASASNTETPTSSVICSSGCDISATESQEDTSFGHSSLRFDSEYVAPSDIVLPPSSFPLLKDVRVTINIVFVGVPSSLVNVTTMQSKLLRWYAPVDRMRWDYEYKLIPYANYTYQYNVDFASSGVANAYANFLVNNYRNGTAPSWIQQYPYSSADASYISAMEAENWFATSFPQYWKDYTLFIVDTYHTSPSFPYRYFYNASVKDLDSGLDPRRSASKYMIAYGGNYRFLFLDLSAGPAEYKDVDDWNVPPVWKYALNEAFRFSTDVAKYVNRAIQERFTPSWIYAPTYFEKYHVEVIIFNNDTAFNYLNYIDVNKIIEEHGRLQPFSSWSGEKRNVTLSDDPALYSVVKKAYDPSKKTVNYNPIYSYLLANLSRYITPHGDARIVPVFIFAFPETIAFEFLGIADADRKGNPAFVVLGTNQYLLGQKIDQATWADRTFSVSRGSFGGVYGELGDVGGRDWLDGSFTITAGKIDFYLLDEFNYYKWRYGNPYKAYIEVRGFSGGYSFSFTPPCRAVYYIVFSNPYAYGSTANINFKAFYYCWYGYGLTQCAIHEIGHFICLSHPHDYFDWEYKYADKTFWLWDFSATPMTYATQNYRFDQLDSDAVHRGRILSRLNATYGLLNYVKSKMTSYGFSIVPPVVYSNINASLYSSALAVGDFSTFDSLDNYERGVRDSLDAYKYALAANSTLFSSLLRLTTRILDANGRPLINAKVMVTCPNGTVRTLYTNSSGYLTITNAPWGNFKYTIYWKGTKVSGTITFLENANVVRTIPVSVYSLSFAFKDSVGTPLYANPTEITVTAPNGSKLQLTSFTITQAQNGTWTLSSILWHGVNIVPSPIPTHALDKSEEWAINCAVYSLSFAFKDSAGAPLYVNPTEVTLTAPNGTRLRLTSFTINQAESGTWAVSSVIWQGNNVVPPGLSMSMKSNTVWSINCRVYYLKILFADNAGKPLYSSPKQISITFPNGTSTTLTSYSFLVQNGTLTVSSIIWNGVNVVPSPIPKRALDKSEEWTIVNCAVYTISYQFKDSKGSKLPNALIKVTHTNGTTATYIADGEGTLKLIQIPKGSYKVEAYWKGVNVGESTEAITSDRGYVLTCQVFDLTIEVKDLLGIAVSGADVRIYFANGTLFASGKTDGAGKAMFSQLPKSEYKVETSHLGLVSSASFPLTATATKGLQAPLSIPVIALIVGIAVAGGGVGFLVMRKRRAKHPPPAYAPPAPPAPPVAPPPTPAPKCPSCGTPVPPDADYCPECGRKLR